MCFSKWQFRVADDVEAEGRGADDTWRRFEQETRSPGPLGYEPRPEREPEEREGAPARS